MSGLYIIIAINVLSVIAILTDSPSGAEMVVAVFGASMAIGLLLKINIVRVVSSVLYYLNSVITALILIFLLWYVIANEVEQSAMEILLGFCLNIVLLGYSLWAAKYLSSPSVTRVFKATNKSRNPTATPPVR